MERSSSVRNATLLFIVICIQMQFSFVVPNAKYVQVSNGIIIKNLSREDAGEYICRAFQVSESVSDIQQLNIQLKVQCKWFESLKINHIFIANFVFFNEVLHIKLLFYFCLV